MAKRKTVCAEDLSDVDIIVFRHQDVWRSVLYSISSLEDLGEAANLNSKNH